MRGLLYLYVHFIIVILFVQARFLRLGGGRRSGLVCWYVRGIRLGLGGGSFFIEDVLVGHSGTVDMRPGFIEMRMKGGGFL